MWRADYCDDDEREQKARQEATNDRQYGQNSVRHSCSRLPLTVRDGGRSEVMSEAAAAGYCRMSVRSFIGIRHHSSSEHLGALTLQSSFRLQTFIPTIASRSHPQRHVKPKPDGVAV
jgi:hypothetical protein